MRASEDDPKITLRDPDPIRREEDVSYSGPTREVLGGSCGRGRHKPVWTRASLWLSWEGTGEAGSAGLDWPV